MASIITDTFQDTDNTLLTAHTATGDHGGFSWSFIAGSGDSDYILNNLLTTHATGTREYRAEVDLDSDDMYVQIDVLTLRSSTNNCAQLFIRAENDSRARYSFALFYASAGTFTYRFRIDDASTGSGDTIQTDTINATTPLTMRMEAVGNNIKCYVDDNLIVDYTDESNTYQGTNYRRTGLAIRGGTNPGVSTTNIDNFEAGVLISSSPDKVFEETASGSDSIIVDKPVSVNDSAVLVDTALGGSPVIFPGATWDTETPANLGLDGSKLDAFATAIGTGIFGSGGLIIKNGYVVKEWGTAGSKHHWASAKKPVFSSILLKAVAEGFLDSVHDLVRPFVQRVYSSDLIPADQNMTFFHLANMISNYGAPNHNPGETFIYNDLAIQLYAELLFWDGGVFDLSTEDANDIIDTYFSALQFEDGDIFNSTYRLVTSNRDFARIAWLWCNKGVWDGTEIIPATLFEQYVQNQIASDFPTSTDTDENDYLNVNDGEVNVVELSPLGPGIYGMNFWFNNFMGETSQRPFPHLPPDTFLAYGNVSGDTAIAVMIPSLRMTAVFFGQVENVGLFNTDIGDPDSLLNSNLKLLAEAAGYSPLENEEQGVDETATATDTVRVNKSFSLEETALASDSFISDKGLVLNETGIASEYDTAEVIYQSDFSVDKDGWNDFGHNEITANVDAHGETDLLKHEGLNDELFSIYAERGLQQFVKKVKYKFKYYLEGGNTTQFRFRYHNSVDFNLIPVLFNQWVIVEGILDSTIEYRYIRYQLYNSKGDTLYLKDFEITELKNPEYLNKDLLLPETGEGIEAALLGKDIGIDETAAVTETIASGKNFIFADSVSGNDNNLVEKNIFIGDAAAGEENILLGKAIICADTAAGEDASDIASGEQQLIIDIGSGEDIVLVNKDLFFNDLASGNEPSVIEKDIFIPEQGAAQENLRIGKAIFVIESASGEDLTEVFTTQIIQNIIDSGSGSDVVLINKNFHLQDNASSQDILSANKDFIFSDNAAGIETLIIKKDLLVEDEGETNDNILTGKVILVLDAAAGAEGITVTVGEKFFSILRLNSTVHLQLQLLSEVQKN